MLGQLAMYCGRMTTTSEIGQRIESSRKAAQRSVTWLSEATGIADKTLRRRLSAPASFTLAELSAVAAALGTDLEYFFFDGEANAHDESDAAHALVEHAA